MDIDESTQSYLDDRVVKRTDMIVDRAVSDAFKTGKRTVKSAMDRVNDGTPEGRNAALESLNGHFGTTWAQFRDPIEVNYPQGSRA